jgi:hypothetical protein
VFPKSKKEIEFWTFLKMSNFEYPNKVLKKAIFSRCDQNALNFIFDFEKNVMLIFCIFAKPLGVFFLFYIYRTFRMDKTPKNSKKYCCESCDFKCCKNNEWERHIATSKHKNKHNLNVLEHKNSMLEHKNSNLEQYICNFCEKKYKARNSLWYHKKKCQSIKETISQYLESDEEYDEEQDDEGHSKEYSKEHSETKTYSSPPTNSEIIEILKIQMMENQELRKFMMDQHKQMMDLALKSNITNNINTNSNCNNNNTFNLQFFLNEKCKDALNINEFVDSIKIQMSDLENFAHMDYPDGVSKIFVKNLNNVDTYLRPIHCSDLKREVLYIKDNNEWIKESDDKPLLKNAIKKIANKNIRQINEWVKEHPGCQDPTTKQNVKYNKIVMNSMSGGTVEEQHDNLEQIVKNITKAVVIDKYAIK